MGKHLANLILLLCATFFLLVAGLPASATTVYVDSTATGLNNGSSWSDAFTELQSALVPAVPGDSIWVAAATYMPTTGSDRVATFQLKNGVVLYGGFAGIETTLGQRDWIANVTILSGSIGVEADSTDNSYHVVTGSGTDSTAVLDGFKVTRGAGGVVSASTIPVAGGMYNYYGSPTLVNLTISRNSGFSAGMLNDNSSPRLTNVVFSRNRHGAMGNIHSSSPTLDNVTFSENSGGDGAMLNEGGAPMLSDVLFIENSGNRGGGVYNFNYTSATFTNVSFVGNTAEGAGGGMYNDTCNPTLINASFSGNTANRGGGMYNHVYGNPTMTNVTFSGNSAGAGGGMYNFVYSDPTLVNVTFSENTATKGGGIYNDIISNPTLTNTILWGDSAAIAGNEIYNATSSTPSSTPVISYSIIEGCGWRTPAGWDTTLGTDGGHNFDVDPLFVDASSGNLRLSSPRSWAVNNGNNTALPPGVTTDLDGNPRSFAEIVDMGAYEYQVLTAIETENRPQPFRIVSVSPNPFNPSTTIRFTLPTAMPVTAGVWSVTGARVRVLANKQAFGPGDNQLIWDGRNDRGSPVASGVYFVRIETQLGAEVARAVLLK